MGETRSTHQGNKTLIQDFSRKTWKEETTWETQDYKGGKVLKVILNKYVLSVRTGFLWLRIGTGDRLLWKCQWAFWFHERLGISWPLERMQVNRYKFGHGLQLRAYSCSVRLMSTTRVTTRPAFRGIVPKTYVKSRVPHFAWNVPQISYFIIYLTILNFRI
jgi:hypothetical protein